MLPRSSMTDDAAWDLPPAEEHVYDVRHGAICIVTAAWNEGPVSLTQYERMLPWTAQFDFIVVNRGEFLPSVGHERLRALQVNTLLQVETPGQSSAYRAGLAYALRRGYEGVIILDSNGKDGVEPIGEFARLLGEGVDLVQGSRFMPGGRHANTPLFRQIGTRLVAAGLLWLATGYWYTDQSNGFKGLSRRFLLDARVQPLRAVFQGHSLLVYLNYAAAKHRFTIVQVPTSRVYPATGPLPTKLTRVSHLVGHLVEQLGIAAGRYDPR